MGALGVYVCVLVSACVVTADLLERPLLPLGDRDTEKTQRFEWLGNRQRFRGTTNCEIKGDLVLIVDSGWSLEDEALADVKAIASEIINKKCIVAGSQDILLLNYGSGLTVVSETTDPDTSSREVPATVDPTRALGDLWKDDSTTSATLTTAVTTALDSMPKLENGVNSYMLNFEYPLDEALDKLQATSATQKSLIFITDGDFGVNQTTLSELVTAFTAVEGYKAYTILAKDPASLTSSYIDRNTSQGSYTERTTNMPALLIFLNCYSIDECPELIQTTTGQTALSVAEAIATLVAAAA